MEGKNISFATVYNTLSKMKKEGLIRELAINNSDYKRYDPNLSSHAHLICKDCGKIDDIPSPLTVEIPDEQRQGFEIHHEDIHFYGLCAVCRNKVHEKNVNRHLK